ncbi:MAG: radical SAM protein [Candidatus Nanoarchaeia archaeon]|nr:radical SAM protein [Candidatus Nanoarchaeia archaeon]
MNNVLGIPSLRIAVTEKCNLDCEYCPRDGDSYRIHGKKLLQKNEFVKIINLAYGVGIRHFSITGGEPLKVPEITFAIAETIKKLPEVKYLRLNTNGILLQNYANNIKKNGFDKVKVSLDSLKKTKNTELTLRGLAEIKKRNIPIRINMVVSKKNADEIFEMIKFCEENEFELKLFDITYYRDCNSANPKFWRENYFSLLPLLQELKKKYGNPEMVLSVGGYGNPMPVFKQNSQSPIRLRISEQEARYVEQCKICPDYMCQDGFCNITLSTDGNLKTCRPEGLDFGLSMVKDGQLLSNQEITKKFSKVIDLFKSSRKTMRSLGKMSSSWEEAKNI